MLRKRGSLLLLLLIASFSLAYAEDIQLKANESELIAEPKIEIAPKTEPTIPQTTQIFTTEGPQSLQKLEEITTKANNNVKNKESKEKNEIKEKIQTTTTIVAIELNSNKQKNLTSNAETGRLKGGTIQFVIEKPTTPYPPHYYTTQYPTRPPPPPHYHYPPYPYPPYPYPPYPTQPTTSRPNFPPFWYGGGFPGGGFPGYGFGYGYPGYGYPWYHHHHHHYNSTLDEGARAVDLGIHTIVSNLDHQTAIESGVNQQPKPIEPLKSIPFFSFLNFNRRKK